MHACCSLESGANDARSQSGTAWAARSSSIVAMSNDGSRCTVFMPASASCASWVMPALSLRVNALYVPRSASGTDSSEIEKSRMCSS